MAGFFRCCRQKNELEKSVNNEILERDLIFSENIDYSEEIATFLHFLPEDCLFFIFNFLNTSDLTVLKRVSKWSKDLVEEYMRSHLYYFALREKHCTKGIEKIICLCPLLRVLKLNNCKNDHDTHFVIDQICSLKYLKTLEMDFCSYLTDTLNAQLFSYCTKLEEIKFDHCAQLTDNSVDSIAALKIVKELKLGYCEGITDSSIVRLVSSHTELEKIDLSECVNITNTTVLSIAQNLPGLKNLHLSYCSQIDDNAIIDVVNACKGLGELGLPDSCTHDALLAVSVSLPNLSVLSLKGCTRVTDDSIGHLVSSSLRLKKLDFSGCTALTDLSVNAIARNLEILTKLDLSGLENLTDDSVIKLASSCTQIEEIYLGACIKLTNKSVCAVAGSLKKLKMLNLSYCYSMSIDEDVFTKLVSCCEELKEVTLIGCYNKLSLSFSRFAQENLPNLKIIYQRYPEAPQRARIYTKTSLSSRLKKVFN